MAEDVSNSAISTSAGCPVTGAVGAGGAVCVGVLAGEGEGGGVGVGGSGVADGRAAVEDVGVMVWEAEVSNRDTDEGVVVVVSRSAGRDAICTMSTTKRTITRLLNIMVTCLCLSLEEGFKRLTRPRSEYLMLAFRPLNLFR